MKSNLKIWTLGALSIAAALFGALGAQADPLVYVPMGSENKITIVDAANEKIVGEIKGLASVHGLAITPNGKFLIAGSFDVRSETDLPTKPRGVSEDDHAAHHKAPSSQSADSSSAPVSTVSIIRRGDHQIVRSIDVPGAVHHASVSPDGQYASVTLPNQDALSIIELSSLKVVATAKTGSMPNYSVFSPDSKFIYVSNSGDDKISVIEVGSWAKTESISVGASPEHVVLDEQGNTLYVNNAGDGTVSVVDTASRHTIKTISIGSTVHGIDLSEDGTSLFVAALGDDKIVQVDLSTGTTRAFDLAPEPYHLTTIPGAGKLYVSSAEKPLIWVIDERNLKIISRINIGGKGHQMVPMTGS